MPEDESQEPLDHILSFFVEDEEDEYESMPETASHAVHMTAGAAAGMFEHLITFPFDVIKVHHSPHSCCDVFVARVLPVAVGIPWKATACNPTCVDKLMPCVEFSSISMLVRCVSDVLSLIPCGRGL